MLTFVVSASLSAPLAGGKPYELSSASTLSQEGPLTSGLVHDWPIDSVGNSICVPTIVVAVLAAWAGMRR